jgi:tight adherence protein C
MTWIMLTALAGGLLIVAAAMLLDNGERNDVKRRLHVKTPSAPDGPAERKLLKRASEAEVSRHVLKNTTNFYLNSDPEAVARIRQQLVRAGYFDPRSVGLFFVLRVVTGLGALVVTCAVVAIFGEASSVSGLLGYAVFAGSFGYFLPNFYLSSQIGKRVTEYRNGFPDFMDLMIVCADAGMSMEAAIDRVSRELQPTYPALSENLQMLSIELRAGRPLEDALRSLSDRLGLDEVRSFATLLHQSRKLGTSLAVTLRIFSDDMRHKRMSRAEEKAHALPAKMSVPVTMCILPVVMLVATIPVIVRFATGSMGQ